MTAEVHPATTVRSINAVESAATDNVERGKVKKIYDAKLLIDKLLCPLPSRRTQRVLNLIAVGEPGECWLWQGCKRNRYGTYCLQYAHRVVWEILCGPIPEGLQVLHHCDNPPCVNPNHLFLGTIRDNHIDKAKKGRHGQQKKTACPQGHPYTPENTYYTQGWRRCKTCYQLRKAARYA